MWRLSQIVKKRTPRVCNCLSHLQTWFHSSPYVASVTTNKALVSQAAAALGALFDLPGVLLYSLHGVFVIACSFPSEVLITLNTC